MNADRKRETTVCSSEAEMQMSGKPECNFKPDSIHFNPIDSNSSLGLK